MTEIKTAMGWISKITDMWKKLEEDMENGHTIYASTASQYQTLLDTMMSSVEAGKSAIEHATCVKRNIGETSSCQLDIESCDKQKVHETYVAYWKALCDPHPIPTSKKYCIQSDVVDQLFEILQSWWKVCPGQPMDTPENLRYTSGVDKLPSYFLGIVGCYGNNLEHQSLDLFLNNFHIWINERLDFSDDSARRRFPVPFDVINFVRNNVPVSLTSVVLWDVMYNSCFYKLSDVPDSRSNLSADMMMRQAECASPAVLYNYKDYMKDPDMTILSRLNIL